MFEAQCNELVDLHFPGVSPRRTAPASPYQSKDQLVAVLKKLSSLEMETLLLYTALPAFEPFHASRATWRLLICGNQTSKTSSAAVEVGRWATDTDPYRKYKTGLGKALAIGLDEAHLADPMAKKLFHPGGFKLIRDERTKLYRFLRPDPNDPQRLDPYDEAYRETWIDAPPIIPPRFFARRPAMKSAAAGVPLSYEFITGKVLEFRSSKSKEKQGDQNHFGWIDEEIEHGGHFTELCRSFMVPKGCGIWSATPQKASFHLWNLYERFKRGDEAVFSVTASLFDNFTVPVAQKEEYSASCRDDAERRVRIFGEFEMRGRQIYPHYDPQGIHGCEASDVPENATRYVFLDPGRQHCATCFIAVDAEEKHRYIYDAFEIRNLLSAQQWAAEIERRQGEYKFEAFIIDGHAGQSHSMAGGASIAEQYWDALVETGVKPRTFGPGKFAGFFPGLDNIAAREEALCRWMDVRPPESQFAGTPMLQVVRGCCPELDKQIQWAQTSNDLADKRKNDYPQDLVTTLEYGAGFNPYYHEPEPIKDDFSPVIRSFEAYQKKQRRGDSRRATSLVM